MPVVTAVLAKVRTDGEGELQHECASDGAQEHGVSHDGDVDRACDGGDGRGDLGDGPGSLFFLSLPSELDTDIACFQQGGDANRISASNNTLSRLHDDDTEDVQLRYFAEGGANVVFKLEGSSKLPNYVLRVRKEVVEKNTTTTTGTPAATM